MIELLTEFIELFLHLDEYLAEIITQYGIWTYALLFLIIFLETGFVITPFLPGDSLLFAAGSFAALGVLNPWILAISLTIAAILGDTVNYWIGHFVGPRAFSGNTRFLKAEYLDRTHAFYEKHGGKTIILARFVPIVRTFAPFVAGVGAMDYRRFFAYNVIGGILWVNIFVWLGYYFGNIPLVKQNFELAIIAIIVLSVVPMFYEYFKQLLEPSEEAA